MTIAKGVAAAHSTLAFLPADVTLFRDASHDRNPLHLSSEYSYRTAFGQQVVYGVLGFLGALASHPVQPAGFTIKGVTADFCGPVFLDVAHQVQWEELSSSKSRFRITDGRRLLMKGSVEWRKSENPAAEPLLVSAMPRLEAALLDDSSIQALTPLEGTYCCPPTALDALLARWLLTERGLTRWAAACLLWSSYAIGMEMPGERALFSKLKLELDDCPEPDSNGILWQATPTSYDERFTILQQSAALKSPGGNQARMELQSFVRQTAGGGEVDAPVPTGQGLQGKTVLVTGGSRGLGASFVRAMSGQAAAVCFSYHRSPVQAAELLEGPGAAAAAWQGDAASQEWCSETASRLERDHGGLDVLVVNACPALTPLLLEPACLDRIHDFLARSVAMASTPLAAFLPLLAKRGGWAVIVSSAAVSHPVAEWPHYGMAKCALEGLAHVAALEYPLVRFLLVRPPRLLTDLTNTPLGRHGALPPQIVAHTVTSYLMEASVAAGTVTMLDKFP